MLNHHKATEAELQEICRWQYTGAYALYNTVSYEEMKAQKFGFANPAMLVETFYDGDTLVGFCNLFEEDREVFFGIGVEPRHCGRGYGQEMTETMAELSRARFPQKPLYLEVRTWNERAIRCYRKAGFTIDGGILRQQTHAGPGEFYRMVKPAASPAAPG